MTIQLVARTKDEASAGIRTMRGEVENLNSPLVTVAKNTKGWNDRNKELNDSVSKVKASISVLKNIVEAVGKAWNWVKNATETMRELASEAGQAQIENQRLQFATEASGLSWDKVSVQAEGFIDKMMRMSRFSDEELKASLQMGIRLFHDYGVAERMTATAADFAASTGKGFIQAQQDIRRVLEGSTASIRRYDATLADLMDTNLKLLPPQTALTKNLALMEERFKGAAQKELGNYTALLLQQVHAMQNLRQTIGSLLLPIFSVLAKNWTNFIFMLDEAVKKSEGFRRVAVIFSEVADRLRGDGGTTQLVIETLARIMDRLGVAIELVVKHVLVITDTLREMAGWGKKAGEEQSIFKDTLEAVEYIVTKLIATIEWLSTKVLKGLGLIIVTVVAQWETFKAVLVVVKDTAVMAFEVIRHGALVAFVGILDIIPYLLEGFASVDESFMSLGLSIGELPLDLLSIMFGASGAAIKAWAGDVKNQESTVRKAIPKIKEFRDAIAGTVVDQEATNKKAKEGVDATMSVIGAKQEEIQSIEEANRNLISQRANLESLLILKKAVPTVRGTAEETEKKQNIKYYEEQITELNKQQLNLMERKKALQESMPAVPELAGYIARNEAIAENNKLFYESDRIQKEMFALSEKKKKFGISDEEIKKINIEVDKLGKRFIEVGEEIEKSGKSYRVPVEIPKHLTEKYTVSSDTNIVESANRAMKATIDWEDSVTRVGIAYDKTAEKAANFVAIYAEKAEAIVKTEFKSDIVLRVETEIKPVEITVDAKDFGDVLIVDRISKSVSDKIYNTLINDPNMKRMRESLDPEDFTRHITAVFNEMMESRRREIESGAN